ncbi:MAG: TlpA disulfide reductase family protein [Breznakibacter sp.]
MALRIKRAITSVWLFIGLCIASQGQMPTDSVRFFGKAPDYAGMNLVFEKTANFITRETQETVRILVDSLGNFDARFALDATSKCWTDLGQYRASIYVEPGGAYKLVLPPYTPKPLADKFNPYFIPEEIEIGIEQGDDQMLNKRLRDFDENFDALYAENVMALYGKGDVAKAQNMVFQLDSIFPSLPGTYFDNHKHARYARIYNIVYRRQKRTAIGYFTDKVGVDFGQPAVVDAFNEIFKDFFLYYFSTPNGKPLKEAYTQNKPFDTLLMVMADDTLFLDPSLREAILLKSLYDGYYSDRYDKPQVEQMVQLAGKSGSTTFIKLLATGITNRFNKLKKGTPAPDFEAYSSSGKSYSLGSFKGKFVYLGFVHTQNYACRKDMISLSAIARENRKDLEVVTIFMDEDPDRAFAFAKQNSLKYNTLHFGHNGKILLDYNIRSMPTYYLIDPEGNISLSPAPAPDESFGKIFMETVRSFKYSKARKSTDTQRSIYDL